MMLLATATAAVVAVSYWYVWFSLTVRFLLLRVGYDLVRRRARELGALDAVIAVDAI